LLLQKYVYICNKKFSFIYYKKSTYVCMYRNIYKDCFRKKTMKTNITTSLDVGIKKIAMEEGIKMNNALEFGIRFLLADKDGGLNFDYPDTRLGNKLQSVLNRLTEQLAKVEKLESLKLEIVPADEVEPTPEGVFNATPDTDDKNGK